MLTFIEFSTPDKDSDTNCRGETHYLKRTNWESTPEQRTMKQNTILLFVQTVTALQAVPVLLASHKLVPALREDIQTPNIKTQLPQDVTNMIKREATECSSDLFLLVDAPGLTSTDMTSFKKDNWPHLQKYLHMSSSVVGLPWVEGTLDFDYITEYIVKTCKAEAVKVHSSEDEVEHYIDTRKRVIRVETDPIPSGQSARDQAVRNVDDLIRKILRKLPSPHYTILITSSQMLPVHPIPQMALENTPEHFDIFYHITSDPSRVGEQERNNYMYQDVEPIWKEYQDPTELYLERRHKDEIHLFDSDLWRKKEKLVITFFLMVVTLFVVKVISLGKSVMQRKKKTKR